MLALVKIPRAHVTWKFAADGRFRRNGSRGKGKSGKGFRSGNPRCVEPMKQLEGFERGPRPCIDLSSYGEERRCAQGVERFLHVARARHCTRRKDACARGTLHLRGKADGRSACGECSQDTRESLFQFFRNRTVDGEAVGALKADNGRFRERIEHTIFFDGTKAERIKSLLHVRCGMDMQMRRSVRSDNRRRGVYSVTPVGHNDTRGRVRLGAIRLCNRYGRRRRQCSRLGLLRNVRRIGWRGR